MATKILPYKTFYYSLDAHFFCSTWERVVTMKEFSHLWRNGIYTSAKTTKQALNVIRYKIAWKLMVPIYAIELFPEDLEIIEKD